MGVMVDQLPHHPVEFVRRVVDDSSSNKLIRISPAANDSTSVSFVFDYERDGVTGVGPEGPHEVLVQLGEFNVIQELVRSSIPVVTGWSALVDSGIDAALEQAIEESEGGGSNGQGYDYRSTVPF